MNTLQIIYLIVAPFALVALYLDLKDYFKNKKEKKVSKGDLPLKNRR